MTYNPTAWVNREVEKPRTYTMVDNGDGTITLTPSEGTIFSAGTPIDAVTMNKFENGLATESARIDSLNNLIQADFTSGTGNGTPTLVVDLTFPKAFATIPIVVAVAQISTLSVAVTNVTTTTAQIVVRHVDNGNWSSAVSLRWIAIGNWSI